MPVISRFFGITISIFYRDHDPPHFHARYANDEITVEIRTGRVTGHFQRRALVLVLEWLDLHREELLGNWTLARLKEPLRAIDPLE